MFIKLTNWKKLSAILVMVGAIFILLVLQTKAATQSDAIAVRVMPNPNHDSIDSWYAKQGYKGSPQSLMVDGYEAIRDGRTVFVNAANLDSVNKKLYTNIYLISYNQESETKTLDILGQLVSHWKFNDNVSTSGQCSISNLDCQTNTDCVTGYICSNENSLNETGKCILKESKTCIIDSDCPVNLFCDSLKAKSIRDVKRLGELNQISSAIESYKTTNGSYPKLQAGTYVLGSSMSVWPSWKETLWAQLGLSQLLFDPINTLGYCAGFDSVTCWNNKNNTFVNSDLSLPEGSYAFVYKAATNGINYLLCSVFETKALGYNTTEGRIMSSACSSGAAANTAPILVNSSIDGIAGAEFNGYLMVKDTEGDSISWQLTPISDFSSWSETPVLVSTNDLSQKKIYAARAGNIGSYDMNLKLTDSRGAINNIKITLNISLTRKMTITADDASYFVDAIKPTYSFYLKDANTLSSYSFTSQNGTYTNIFSNKMTDAALITNPDNLKVTVPLQIPAARSFSNNVTIPFRIVVNNYGSLVTKDININLNIEKPLLNLQCNKNARIGEPYQIDGSFCLLGSLTSGNHTISYNLNSSIPGLVIKNQNGFAFLTADAINLLAPSSSIVTINSSNEYGASSSASFNLSVDTFCGDGIKETPNSEGKGGVNNDGNEQCDGVDGLATSVSDSSVTKQYGCSTGLGVKTPFPILNNNYCIFTSPADTGGYCGDGYCQDSHESCSTCSTDCGVCVKKPVCGDGVLDTGEVCDSGMTVQNTCDNITEWITPPSYCTGVIKDNINLKGQGVQNCKPDCSGWGQCIGGSPDLVVNVATGCFALSPKLSGYSCCELVDCTHDNCDCCGRSSTVSGWLDLVSSAYGDNYKNIIKKVTPDNGACTYYYYIPGAAEQSSATCDCGKVITGPYGNGNICPSTPNCSGKGDNPTLNSCVLAQDSNNLKNWAIYTNHTSAFYRCWK